MAMAIGSSSALLEVKNVLMAELKIACGKEFTFADQRFEILNGHTRINISYDKVFKIMMLKRAYEANCQN
jgi:hypothetical protein